MSNIYPYNIAKGNNALSRVSVDASYNIAFGYSAGSNLINGNNNTFIGSNTNINSSSNTFSNSTAIGSGATIDASNQIMLGTALQNVVVPGTLTGFGVTLPSFKVSIISNSITSIGPYSFVPIPYNVVDYDYNLGGTSGSNYNASTYVYTVPLSGKYNFTYFYDVSGANTYGSFISINNTTTYPSDPSGGQLYICDDNYNTSGTDYSQGSLSIKLNKNDKVNIFGYFKDYTSLSFIPPSYFNVLYTKNTGGTITYMDSNGTNPRTTLPYPNGYVLHTFSTPGSYSFVCYENITIDYLIVAGGGGGGHNNNSVYPGGGGGGGFLTGSILLNSGAYTVDVGSKGLTITGGYNDGTNGGNSLIQSVGTAIGGGGGSCTGKVGGDPGKAGGSGGGAGSSSYPGGAGTPGQGNNGSTGVSTIAGGAGGGAGSAASGSTRGQGLINTLSGTTVRYSSGGGFGTDYATTPGSGGPANTINGSVNAQDGIVLIRYPYSLNYVNMISNWFTGEMVSY